MAFALSTTTLIDYTYLCIFCTRCFVWFVALCSLWNLTMQSVLPCNLTLLNALHASYSFGVLPLSILTLTAASDGRVAKCDLSCRSFHIGDELFTMPRREE